MASRLMEDDEISVKDLMENGALTQDDPPGWNQNPGFEDDDESARVNLKLKNDLLCHSQDLRIQRRKIERRLDHLQEDKMEILERLDHVKERINRWRKALLMLSH